MTETLPRWVRPIGADRHRCAGFAAGGSGRLMSSKPNQDHQLQQSLEFMAGFRVVRICADEPLRSSLARMTLSGYKPDRDPALRRGPDLILTNAYAAAEHPG
jgi:hypothetical protein